MARKLKTYATSIGFYDLIIAAPSMKAALEAWGARQNLFHQGLAEEVEDAGIIAAAMEKPGVILRRPVGTDAPFREKADLPISLPDHTPKREPKRRLARKRPVTNVHPKGEKAAILDFEKEKAKRDKARAQEEAARVKEKAALERAEKRQEKMAAKAQAALDKARKRHEARLAELERGIGDERARWGREERALKDAVREARE